MHEKNIRTVSSKECDEHEFDMVEVTDEYVVVSAFQNVPVNLGLLSHQIYDRFFS